jgi:hypothetical protein
MNVGSKVERGSCHPGMGANVLPADLDALHRFLRFSQS